jgi:hypothetical protein
MEFPKMLKKADGSRLVVADQAEQDVAAESGWLTSAQLKASLEAPVSLAEGVAEVLEELVESVAPRRGRPRKA